MTFPAVEFPDAEFPLAQYLEGAFAEVGEDVTVGIDVPADWTPKGSKPHVQVVSDGTPILLRQCVAFTTIRLTAWARYTNQAKQLAARAQGLLCAFPGTNTVTGVRPLTGVLPARDPQTHAEIASTTSRVTVRSAPIEPSGS